MPMIAGHYGGVNGGEDTIDLTIPEIPEIILGFLSDEMIFDIKGTNATGQEDLCLKITIQLDIPEPSQ